MKNKNIILFMPIVYFIFSMIYLSICTVFNFKHSLNIIDILGITFIILLISLVLYKYVKLKNKKDD